MSFDVLWCPLTNGFKVTVTMIQYTAELCVSSQDLGQFEEERAGEANWGDAAAVNQLGEWMVDASWWMMIKHG